MENKKNTNWISKITRFTIASYMIVSAIAMCFGLVACKKKDDTIVIGNDTTIVSPDKGLSITDNSMDNVLKQFVQGKLQNTADVSWMADSLAIEAADKTSDNIEIIDKYSNRNALFVKVHDITNESYYTYRFQMNEENVIESYIRFQLMY